MSQFTATLLERTSVHTAFIRIKVDPAAADQVAQAMLTLTAPTFAEPGCHTYEFYRDNDDPSLFLCFEHWDSRQALDDHGSTPHVQTFLTEFGPHIQVWEQNHTTALA
ncbi:putative quinol monooxygenase [Nocardia tengchongensis]